MANIIGELLFAIAREFIAAGVRSLFFKVGTWLDTKISRRSAKVAIGLLLGLVLFFFIPVILGLLGL